MLSIVFAMLGQGGGSVYTPLQVIFGYDFHSAATNSLFLIMVSSASATAVYRKAKRIDIRMALTLEVFSASGALIGGLYSASFSPKFLALLFASVVSVAGVFMLRGGGLSSRKSADSKSRFKWRRTLGDEKYSINLLIAIPLFFLVGTISGLIGIGGGVMKVPIMVILLGVPMGIAVGCSAFMIGFTACFGFVGHVVSGHWDVTTSLVLAVAVFIGGQLGARMAIGLNQWKLRRVCACFMMATAMFMAAEAMFFVEMLTGSDGTQAKEQIEMQEKLATAPQADTADAIFSLVAVQ